MVYEEQEFDTLSFIWEGREVSLGLNSTISIVSHVPRIYNRTLLILMAKTLSISGGFSVRELISQKA